MPRVRRREPEPEPAHDVEGDRRARPRQREREPRHRLPDTRGASPDVEPRLVARAARPRGARAALTAVQPPGRRLRLRGGVRDARRRRAEAGRRRVDDRLPGMVARRLRPLRAALHPHDVARGRHVPHRRRARRRWSGRAAIRAAQQLARQREPRQGPPAALADQAEVRPEDLVGRPHRLHRQRRARVDGLRDLRLRLRSARHLGTRGDLLGFRGHVARRRALQRRARPRRSARCRADGAHLREPRGPQRQPRSARRRARHPRDLRAHGHERRGDGRTHRRWSHVRQVPRRELWRPRGSRARGVPGACAGSRLAQQWRDRRRCRRGDQRPRGRVDQRPDAVGQRVPREPLRLRLGAHREPCRREAVDAEGPGGAGHGARRARSVEAARADDADDRPRVALRPDLRTDHPALPRAPRRARPRVRQGLVQVAPPRHGPGVAVSRTVGAGAAAVAGPGTGRCRRATRRRRRRGAEGEGARLGPLGGAARGHRVGVGVDVPRHRQARRRERRAACGSRRSTTGP